MLIPFVRPSAIRSGVLAVIVAVGVAGAVPAQWQSAKLTASDAAAGDQFGISVSVSGDTALVGAVGGGVPGAAYVLVRDGLGNWKQQARLTASDGAAGDNFGGSVSVSGDTALVGANRDDDAGSSSGSAYVFVRDVFGGWTQQAKLTASDAAAGENFGISVSLNGDRALIGAGTQGFPLINGSAYVFERDGAGSWTQPAKLTAADGALQDAFGAAVSLSGDTALIGLF